LSVLLVRLGECSSTANCRSILTVDEANELAAVLAGDIHLRSLDITDCIADAVEASDLSLRLL
jgi:hypothetical protein